MLALQDLGGLDTLPGRRKLDEDALLANANRLVQVDDVQSLVNRGLLVERETGVDLGRDLAGDDFENLLAELDEEAVEGGVNFLVES